MGKFVVGDVVVTSFPFSNLKRTKQRPALVVAQGEFDNIILCQITSKSYTSNIAVVITYADFVIGSLPVTSYVRPDKLFTTDPDLIQKIAGRLHKRAQRKILAKVRALFAIA